MQGKTAILFIFFTLPAPPALLAQDSVRVENIAPLQADSLLRTDTTIVVLDVRTPGEFKSESGHLRAALLLPVQELEERLGELEPYREKTIVTYCRSGVRSARAAAILSHHGFRVLNMTGGILEWNSEKLPVVKEQ